MNENFYNMGLIDKNKLLEELEELKQNLSASPIVVIEDVKSLVESFEEKEVNLEKEIKDYIYTLPHAKTGVQNGWRLSWHEDKVMEIAKHFYELGLAQKEK